MSTAMANLKHAKNNLRVLRGKYQRIAQEIKWAETPECLQDVDWNDVDSVVEASAALRKTIDQAETEQARRTAITAVPDHTAAYAAQVPEAVPNDSEDALATAFQEPGASETLIIPVAEQNALVTGVHDALSQVRDAVEEARENQANLRHTEIDRRATRLAWGAVIAISFVLGFMLAAGLGHIGLVGGLLLATLLFGHRLMRGIKAALINMSGVTRAIRIGVILGVSTLVLGSAGMATASVWTWLVSLLVLGLFADRVLTHVGATDTFTMTIEHPVE